MVEILHTVQVIIKEKSNLSNIPNKVNTVFLLHASYFSLIDSPYRFYINKN